MLARKPRVFTGQDCARSYLYQARVPPRSLHIDATASATCPAKFRIEKYRGYLPEMRSVSRLPPSPVVGALGSFVTFPGSSGPVLLPVQSRHRKSCLSRLRRVALGPLKNGSRWYELRGLGLRTPDSSAVPGVGARVDCGTSRTNSGTSQFSNHGDGVAEGGPRGIARGVRRAKHFGQLWGCLRFSGQRRRRR